MIIKYPISYMFAFVVIIGVFFLFQRKPSTPSLYSSFIVQMAEDFYELSFCGLKCTTILRFKVHHPESDPNFQNEERERFMEWYIKGFLNGYRLQTWYLVDKNEGYEWEGYLQGKYYRRKHPDSMDSVMKDLGYIKVRGSGIWEYAYELNSFHFIGDEQSYQLIPLGIVMPYFDHNGHEVKKVDLKVEGYIGPKNIYGYVKQYKIPIYEKTLYLTKIDSNKTRDQIASSSAAHD